jgi:GGDEF domain-containing protein
MLRLSELIAEMSQDKALDGLVDLAVKSSAELFGASLATLRLFPDGTLAMSDEHFPEKDPLAERLLSFDEHISRQAIKQNEVLTLANMPPSHEELVAGLPQVQWMSILPLNCGEGYEGVLSLYGMTRESQDPKGDELLMIEKFRSYLGRSLGKALAQGGAGERFMRWTAFREKLEEEFKRANRYGRSFVVTIVDIDGWAQASAANGRDWNEGARYALTEFIWHHVRDVDVPAWIQEGRIAILCPEIQGGSEALARRLEAEWANLVPGLKLKDMDTMQFKAREIHFPGMTRQLDEIIARIIQPEHGDQERSLTA